MPRDDDDFRTRRRKREEDEKTGTLTHLEVKTDQDTTKLDELIRRAEPLIEQVNALYSQYVAGVERLPPIERRRALDQLMNSLLMIHKPTPTLRFRVGALIATYQQYKDRWERTLRDIESGKTKRRG